MYTQEDKINGLQIYNVRVTKEMRTFHLHGHDTYTYLLKEPITRKKQRPQWR